MCDVVKYFSYGPCGCDIEKPNRMLELMANNMINKQSMARRLLDLDDEWLYDNHTQFTVELN